MVDRDTARRLALALPESVEQDHHGFPSFRVRGKIFATMPDPEHVNVMLEENAIHDAVMVAPHACSEGWWGRKLAAVRVTLASVDEELLRTLLRDAWTRKAGPRLAR
jgi:hypothetical protein